MLDYGAVSLFNTFGHLHLPSVFSPNETDYFSSLFDLAIGSIAGDSEIPSTFSTSPWGKQDNLGIELLTDERISKIPPKSLGHGALLRLV